MISKYIRKYLKKIIGEKLLKRISSTHRIEAWTGLMQSLIQKNEGSLVSKAYQFLIQEINIVRDVTEPPIEYPDSINSAVIETNSEICKSSERLFSTICSCNLLICYSGDKDSKENSEKTYKTIWRCLSEQIYRKRDDLVYEYWIYAIQRYSSYFQYNQGDDDVKDRYVEFHIALCGQLLSEKRYELLSEIMFKSNTVPPEYKLIPSSFDLLFKWYLRANESSYSDRFYFESKYVFFRNKDIFDSNIERVNIRIYLALLCIRLKYVEPNYQNDILAFNRERGKSLNEITRYIDACESLLKDIKGIDEEVCNKVFVNRRYEDNTIDVIDIIKSYQYYLTKKYNQIKEEQNISNDIVLAYKKSIGEILKNKIRLFQYFIDSNIEMPVFSEDIAEQFSKGVYANNASFYSQLDSSNFKDGQSFAVANLDNSIAEYVISNLHHNVAAVFSSRCGTLRSVYYDNIITAFQKMSPDPQKHVALCFGAGSILQSKLKTVNNGDNVYEYNGFEIYNLPGSPALEPFIVFISKSLVPKITIINPKEEIKNKYKLERITEKYNIYLGIVDLKKDSDLKRWLLRDNKMTKEQLKDKCFVTTYFYYYLYIPVGCILGGFKLVDSFSGVANEIKYLGALPRS